MNRFSLQLDEIKAAFAAEPNPSLDIRLERIARIEKMIQAMYKPHWEYDLEDLMSLWELTLQAEWGINNNA